VTAQQIRSAADVPARTYSVRGPGGPLDPMNAPDALSLQHLLEVAGVAGDVRFVELPRARNGDSLLLPSGYRGDEGPLIFWVDGDSVHYFRPLAGAQDVNDSDNYATPTGTSQLTIDGHSGNLLQVDASASPDHGVRARDDVVFTATAQGAAAGEQLDYEWEFGDGTTGSGASVHHAYKSARDWVAKVTVIGSGDSLGAATVSLHVGTKRTSPGGTGSPGGGSGGTGSPGSGSGGTGSPGSGNGGSRGTGRSGSGGPGSRGGGGSRSSSRGSGTPAARAPTPTPAAPRPNPKPVPRPTPRRPTPPAPAPADGLSQVRGILLADAGAPVGPAGVRRTLSSLLPGAAASSGRGPDSDTGALPAGGIATVALLLLGAFRERRPRRVL
jgi:hypothetical protein